MRFGNSDRYIDIKQQENKHLGNPEEMIDDIDDLKTDVDTLKKAGGKK
jgi:hypothetical protein